jgi:6,7-dimethyl-8-ribityllumazine synthase
MATKDLSSKHKVDLDDPKSFEFGIVVSEWNETITAALKSGCVDTLLASGVPAENIHELSVPGSFELPAGVKMLMTGKKLDAVICIGCVIRGETSHNEYINHAVAGGLTQLSLVTGVPCIFGVLTPNSEQQALDRAGGKLGNKGVEAAHTALKMAILKKEASEPKKKIGFS